MTHPGRQHSHQAALALQKAELLAGYWAGVPATAEQKARLPAPLRRFVRYAPFPIEPTLARSAPWCPALRRIGDAALPVGLAGWNDLLACRLFDRWAAKRLPSAAPRMVLACEISALTTFTTARNLGMKTVLDAPSLHHSAQDRLHGTEDSPRLHRRIVAIKDAEIELADHIVTVSELARQTYVDAGVPAAKVLAVGLGADLELFRPASAAPPADGDFVFVFAGATSHRKGFDLLLDAFGRVAAVAPSVRLRVIGPVVERGRMLARTALGRIEIAGQTDQRGLAAAFRQAHCLVLPSRNDSYGMVVAEALATGLPVLVSDMVGAKDLVVEGRNGWVVPAADASALADRMVRCVRERGTLAAMREDCRRAVATASWADYHRRFADLMRRILGGAGG